MDRNFSYTYILPLLCEQVDLKVKILNHVTNTYLKTSKHNEDGKLFIMCKFDYGSRDFAMLESLLTNNDLFVDSYDVGNKILYEFNLPEDYIKEQKLFMEGKYSEFGDDVKDLILQFWSELYGHIPSFVSGVLTHIRHVLQKHEKLRLKLQRDYDITIVKGSELGDLINIKDETYQFKDTENKIDLKNIKQIF